MLAQSVSEGKLSTPRLAFTVCMSTSMNFKPGHGTKGEQWMEAEISEWEVPEMFCQVTSETWNLLVSQFWDEVEYTHCVMLIGKPTFSMRKLRKVTFFAYPPPPPPASPLLELLSAVPCHVLNHAPFVELIKCTSSYRMFCYCQRERAVGVTLGLLTST